MKIHGIRLWNFILVNDGKRNLRPVDYGPKISLWTKLNIWATDRTDEKMLPQEILFRCEYLGLVIVKWYTLMWPYFDHRTIDHVSQSKVAILYDPIWNKNP